MINIRETHLSSIFRYSFSVMDVNFFDKFHLYSNLSLGWGRTTYKDEWTLLKDMPQYSGVGAIVSKDDETA